MTFHKIDKDSPDTLPSSLDLFTIPATNVAISNSEIRQYLTLNALIDPPYRFKIFSSNSFLDLSRFNLLVEFRIRKENLAGQLINLDPDENVAPIQMISACAWKDIKLSINNRQVWDSNSMYAWKAYLDTELSFPTTVKDSSLTAAGYYRDQELDQEQGLGFAARKALFANSKVAQFITKIDCDLLNQPRLLVPFCEVDLELIPNDPKFSIIAPGAPDNARYHLEVMGLRLFVKTVQVTDGLALNMARKLEQQPARYPIRKSMLKAVFISENRYQINANLFNDVIPRRIIFGLVSNSDYTGNTRTSPFKFKHFNLRECTILANGHAYPATPYTLDYSNDQFVRAFHDMLDGAGLAGTLGSNGITMDKFKNGWCIYVFNLTNSMEDNGDVFDLIKNGSTSIDLKFSQPIPIGGIVLVALGEVDSLLMVDNGRTIATDTTL